jgi:hypothetical protein
VITANTGDSITVEGTCAAVLKFAGLDAEEFTCELTEASLATFSKDGFMGEFVFTHKATGVSVTAPAFEVAYYRTTPNEDDSTGGVIPTEETNGTWFCGYYAPFGLLGPCPEQYGNSVKANKAIAPIMDAFKAQAGEDGYIDITVTEPKKPWPGVPGADTTTHRNCFMTNVWQAIDPLFDYSLAGEYYHEGWYTFEVGFKPFYDVFYQYSQNTTDAVVVIETEIPVRIKAVTNGDIGTQFENVKFRFNITNPIAQ